MSATLLIAIIGAVTGVAGLGISLDTAIRARNARKANADTPELREALANLANYAAGTITSVSEQDLPQTKSMSIWLSDLANASRQNSDKKLRRHLVDAHGALTSLVSAVDLNATMTEANSARGALKAAADRLDHLRRRVS